jgi:hypothetical protein
MNESWLAGVEAAMAKVATTYGEIGGLGTSAGLASGAGALAAGRKRRGRGAVTGATLGGLAVIPSAIAGHELAERFKLSDRARGALVLGTMILGPMAVGALGGLATRLTPAREKTAGEEQTRGEFEAATSSPGHGSTQFTGMVDRTERRPGNQGSRGVPEWLRLLKDLPGQTTWSGGDRIGPQKSDKQFDTPLAGGK